VPVPKLGTPEYRSSELFPCSCRQALSSRNRWIYPGRPSDTAAIPLRVPRVLPEDSPDPPLHLASSVYSVSIGIPRLKCTQMSQRGKAGRKERERGGGGKEREGEEIF